MKAEMKSSTPAQRGTVQVSVTFDQAGLKMIQTPFGMLIELEDSPNRGEPGGPALPGKVIRVALPPLARVESVTGEAMKTVHLTKEAVLVAPLQRPQPGAQGKSQRKPQGEPDGRTYKPSSRLPVEERFVEPLPAPDIELPRPELYEREARQPRPLAALVATEDYGMVPAAVIEVAPVRIGEGGTLEFYPEIEVTVAYELDGPQRMMRSAADGTVQPLAFARPIHSRTQAQRLVDLARMQVINPDAVFDFTPLFPVLITHVDYLIITDNQTWNETSIAPAGPAGNLVEKFTKLTEWKTMRGLKTRIVTVTDIVNGKYGNFTTGARDLQEVIRSFLKWAYDAWGVAWVLLGGDMNIIPVRRVPGASEGHIDVASVNPPENNRSFWTGTFLKMHVVNPGTWWPGSRTDHLLVRADNGLLIPYDSAGTSGPAARGWYFTTDSTYTTRTSTPTQYVRVNGPAAEVNTRLQWLYEWNMLPTDLYYASLVGPNYDLPGRHDWDLDSNRIYGQHTNNLDMDGVDYQTDLSVGRAPVASETQAQAFVSKIIAYEQFRQPDGTLLNMNWPRKMLLVSSNWGGRIWIGPGSNPPADNKYYHAAGAAYSRIKLKDVPTDLLWQLISQVTAADVRLIPYNHNAGSSSRGWYFAQSESSLAVSGLTFSLFGTEFHYPIPTNYVVVYGAAAELAPQGFIFDRDQQDGSMHDQEELRKQIVVELTGINTISRLYEDEVDLSAAEAAAAPVSHLTEDRLQAALNAGPHFVSLSGHGNSDGCCALSGWMASGLTNGYHSFIGYADSCLTNQFDAEDAVSEKLLYNPNGGGVAYIGNTRFSWIGVGDNFQRAFFHRLTSTRHLGLLNDTRVGMVNESTGFYRLYNKWAIFTLNLMGDPEMPVWAGRPATMTVKFPRVLDKRQPFTVHVEHRLLFIDIPLAGAVVHIQQGSFTRIATTDASGRATFDLNPAELGELQVTVTRIGYIPFMDKARITGPAWVRGTVIGVLHQHGSPNRSLVRLHLSSPIDGDSYRGWYAQKLLADYAIILDAATDAYVTGKQIALFVNNTDEGGTIEKFKFEQLLVFPRLPDIIDQPLRRVLEGSDLAPVVAQAENGGAALDETPAAEPEVIVEEAAAPQENPSA